MNCDAVGQADPGKFRALAGLTHRAAAGRIARLCHGMQFMFDPDRIVIGGGVGLAPGYLDRVTRALAHLDPLVRADLVAARLGRDAGIIGMADLALDEPINWEKTQ